MEWCNYEIFAKVVHILVRFNLKIPNLIHIVPNNKITKYQLLVIEQKIQKKRFNYIKVRTKIKVDRSLSSISKKYIIKINRLMGYNKSPSISEIIKNYL